MDKIEHYIHWKKFVFATGLIWLVQGTYTTLNTGLFQQYSGTEVRWTAISIYSFGTAFVWWLLTPLIFWLILQISNRVKSVYSSIGLHLLLAIMLASIQRLITIAIIYNAIKWTEAVDLSLLKLENFFGMNFLRNVGNGVLVYFVIAGILYGYLYYIKNRVQEVEQTKLTAALSKVKLENLKYQLQPHFLFNSLQAISTLLHRDVKAADQALGDLGDLLRYSIRNIDKEKGTLGEELMSLQKYLDLQQTRFGDQLQTNIKFEDNLIGALVPAFLLQPIVENSIKHNIEKTGSAIRVEIQISKSNEKLVIQVTDNGPPNNDPSPSSGNGIGTKNLQLRLEALYGEKASIQSESLVPTGYQTIIKLPYENLA
jgi:hypothetical protein